MAQPAPELDFLGRAVKQIRSERGISQERLGLEAGLDRTYIYGIERGRRNLSYSSLLRVASALEVKASHIVLTAEAISTHPDERKPNSH